MELKRRPILTVYEVKRASLSVLAQDKTPTGIMVADHSGEHARWLGEVSFPQNTMSGLQTRRVKADLFAVGHDYDFTPDRGIEIVGTVLDTRKPFTFRYSMRESAGGVSILLRRFEGESISRDLGRPVGVNYAFKTARESPEGSVYSDDLITTPHNREYLDLIESFTSAMLEASGVSPKTDK